MIFATARRLDSLRVLTRAIGCASCVLIFRASSVCAQNPGFAAIDVRVADALDVAISGAEIRLRDPQSGEIRLMRSTNASGAALFSVQSRIEPFELEVRHVRFISTRRLIVAKFSQPVRIEIRLSRIQPRLGVVRTVDRALPLEKRPLVDSLEIAASKRAILDLNDVMRKLRPDMLYQAYRCLGSRVSPPLRVYVDGAFVPPDVLRPLLREIRAEHIAEVRYVNCGDPALAEGDYPQAGRLVVTLKRGFAFSLKRGTYAPGHQPPRATLPVVNAVSGSRIVGVFDEATGRPIEGAIVTDIASRMSARTTSTGTVSLFFVDTLGGVVRIEKAGYALEILAVNASLGNRAPLTIVLQPRAETSVGAVGSVADASPKLDAVGFYARRETWTPTAPVFLLGSEVQRIGMVSQLVELIVSPSCHRSIRIDGTLIKRDSASAVTWIDALLSPAMVVGVELYFDEPPSELAMFVEPEAPRPVAATRKCAALIWTT